METLEQSIVFMTTTSLGLARACAFQCDPVQKAYAFAVLFGASGDVKDLDAYHAAVTAHQSADLHSGDDPEERFMERGRRFATISLAHNGLLEEARLLAQRITHAYEHIQALLDIYEIFATPEDREAVLVAGSKLAEHKMRPYALVGLHIEAHLRERLARRGDPVAILGTLNYQLHDTDRMVERAEFRPFLRIIYMCAFLDHEELCRRVIRERMMPGFDQARAFTVLYRATKNDTDLRVARAAAREIDRHLSYLGSEVWAWIFHESGVRSDISKANATAKIVNTPQAYATLYRATDDPRFLESATIALRRTKDSTAYCEGAFPFCVVSGDVGTLAYVAGVAGNVYTSLGSALYFARLAITLKRYHNPERIADRIFDSLSFHELT